MNENILSFLKKLEQDEEAQKRFSVCRDPEEAWQMAHAIQDGFTKEEFIETMKSLYDQVNRDLSAEDLAKASGGKDEEEGVGVSLSIAVSASWTASLSVMLVDFSVITCSASSAL